MIACIRVVVVEVTVDRFQIYDEDELIGFSDRSFVDGSKERKKVNSIVSLSCSLSSLSFLQLSILLLSPPPLLSSFSFFSHTPHSQLSFLSFTFLLFLCSSLSSTSSFLFYLFFPLLLSLILILNIIMFSVPKINYREPELGDLEEDFS